MAGSDWRRWMIPWGALGLLLSTLLASAPAPASPEARGQRVLVASIEGMIDLGLGPFVQRVLEEAARDQAALVVFEINTFGGRVDAAVAIRDHLLATAVPTVAFINRRAISAGALISLAAEEIAITPGGTIGAATPVQMSGEETGIVTEKNVSYLRKEFRSTADARGRPGELAEAMVDPDVEIPVLSEKGKLLTLTTEDALTHGIADYEASSLSDLLAALELSDAELRHVELNWAERVVRFLTHPAVSSLLMALGMLGLLIELRTPGVGIPGLVGVLSLSAFFWGHALVQLVGWEQVLLLVAGVLLLAAELFLIPGFGVAGVLGVLAIVASLSTSLIGAGASLNAIVQAVTHVAFSGILAALAAFAAFKFLPRLPGGRRLVLSASLGDGGGEPEQASWVGKVGTTLTPLRPAGIATFEGHRLDVVSQGDFIPAGEAVEVISQEGFRVVVARPLQHDENEARNETSE